jgi:nucleotide-binding universal stress UspA family protein
VADELLPQITCPVVMVGGDHDPKGRPPRGAGGGTLLVCFDGSQVSASIASLATTWARELELKAHVAMVVHRDGTFLGNVDATVPKQLARDFTEQLVEAGVPATLDLLDGLDPARAIADHAASLPASLVMTSTHGAGGVVRKALGSIALRIARHAPCPVVVRRPEGAD